MGTVRVSEGNDFAIVQESREFGSAAVEVFKADGRTGELTGVGGAAIGGADQVARDAAAAAQADATEALSEIADLTPVPVGIITNIVVGLIDGVAANGPVTLLGVLPGDQLISVVRYVGLGAFPGTPLAGPVSNPTGPSGPHPYETIITVADEIQQIDGGDLSDSRFSLTVVRKTS